MALYFTPPVSEYIARMIADAHLAMTTCRATFTLFEFIDDKYTG